jgi:DNA-binding MarR family transcriptional regulator
MNKLNPKYLPEDPGQKTWVLWQHVSDLISSYIDETFFRTNKISYEQFIVLLLIRSIGREANATRLSGYLERNPNTLTTILDRMEKHGLVKKTRDTIDRRVVYVSLTERGKKIIKSAQATGDQLIDRFNESFSEEERNAFGSFVDKLDKVISLDRAERQSKKRRGSRVSRGIPV